MVWVIVSLAAGSFQTVRNGLARSLSGRLPATVLSWARFAFNLPFATALVAALYWLIGDGPPRLSLRFAALVLAAAVSQLLGNVALVSAFSHATFAQAIVVHKTEVVMAALVGVLAFAEDLPAQAWVGIIASVVGVAMIARAGTGAGWGDLLAANRGTALALLAGALLVVAGYSIRYAGFELADLVAAGSVAGAGTGSGSGSFANAATTLFHVTWVEVLILTVWLAATNRAVFGQVPEHLGRLFAIGAAGFAGSLCWFWAFSMTYVSYVKAVGQIESVLSVLLAVYVWKERRTTDQLPGIALTVAGILLLVLS